MIKLPTSYLPEKIRSAVRFTVIGTTGMFVQTWCFMAALYFLAQPEKGCLLYFIAFGIGYVLEMIPNYLFSNWYTCSLSRPVGAYREILCRCRRVLTAATASFPSLR